MPPTRTIAHRVYFSDLAASAGHAAQTPFDLTIDGPEAHHGARVKRLRVGEDIELFDGLGSVAPARILEVGSGKRARLVVKVGGLERVAPIKPRIEVWCPPPKGDRLETMLDQLSQVGVAAWRPLRTARTEREGFGADKAERAVVESAKQCGRAWLMELGDWARLDDALADPRCTLADASGGPPPTSSGGDLVLLLGPEGGWAPEEIESCRASGRSIVRFGPHIMRIETAAVAGAGTLLAHATHVESPATPEIGPHGHEGATQ